MLNREVITDAAEQAVARGLHNATFVAQDATALEATSACDFITAFDAIHDQADPGGVLRRVRGALRPGGAFLMVDIATSTYLEKNLDNALAPLLFTISTMHCTTVSLAASGEGLGACWGVERARVFLSEAGFTTVDTFTVDGGPLNIYFRCAP